MNSLRLNPISLKALLGYARILGKNGKPEEAIYVLKKCIALYPDVDSVHFHFGSNLFRYFRDFQGALHHFEIALSMEPNAEKTHY